MKKQLPNNLNANEIIKKTKVFLLDLDGTVYIDGELIGEVKHTLQAFRQSGKQLVFLTNNSSKNEQTYVNRLSDLGVFENQDIVYSSGRATIEYLTSEHRDKSVYLVATDGVKQSFRDAGINLVESGVPDICVLAFDTELNYDKMCKFNFALRRGAFYVATHPDLVCPAKDEPIPDVGAFIAMFEKSSNRTPDVIIGKPFTGMGKAVVEKFKVKPEEITMVGDRLSTDIKFACNNGFNSILVLSGESTKQDYLNSDVTATLMFDSINDAIKYL